MLGLTLPVATISLATGRSASSQPATSWPDGICVCWTAFWRKGPRKMAPVIVMEQKEAKDLETQKN